MVIAIVLLKEAGGYSNTSNCVTERKTEFKLKRPLCEIKTSELKEF